LIKQKYKPISPTLVASIRDGRAHAVMLGAGEAYIAAFIILLGASTLQIGVLATLPMLLGAFFQRLGVWLMERYNHRRNVLAAGAFIQSVSWLLIIAVPYFLGFSHLAVGIVIAIFAFYHVLAGLIGPAWNSLIGDLVPDNERGRFFGLRTQQTSIITFVSLILAGVVIGFFERQDLAVMGFIIIFGASFLARLLSAYFLSQHENPKFAISPEEKFTFFDFIRRSPWSNFAQFVFFIAAMNFAVAFASPYFTLYMLKDVGFSYWEFTLVSATVIISQFITLRNWGAIADKYGYKKIISVCTTGIAILPLLWLVSANLFYLLFVQAVSGIVWAGYNLAAANFLFDAVTPPKRGRCAAYMGIINGLATFLGSMIGGVASSYLPSDFLMRTIDSSAGSQLLALFLVSTVLRVIAAYFFLNRFNEVRQVEQTTHKDIVVRIVHLRPIQGYIFGFIAQFNRGKRLKELKAVRSNRNTKAS